MVGAEVTRIDMGKKERKHRTDDEEMYIPYGALHSAAIPDGKAVTMCVNITSRDRQTKPIETKLLQLGVIELNYFNEVSLPPTTTKADSAAEKTDPGNHQQP